MVKSARKRPRSLGQPFTRWSIRKLAGYLAVKKGREVTVGRERMRQILAEEGITFQRTKTWKESPDPLHVRRSWLGSSTCWSTSGTAPSRSTSSGR